MCFHSRIFSFSGTYLCFSVCWESCFFPLVSNCCPWIVILMHSILQCNFIKFSVFCCRWSAKQGQLESVGRILKLKFACMWQTIVGKTFRSSLNDFYYKLKVIQPHWNVNERRLIPIYLNLYHNRSTKIRSIFFRKSTSNWRKLTQIACKMVEQMKNSKKKTSDTHNWIWLHSKFKW